jgi:competence protein ComEC
LIIEKPQLFESVQGFVATILFLSLIVLFRVILSYHAYQDFIQKPFYYTYATVLHAYEKRQGNRRYQVLKLLSDEGLRFYTTTHYKRDYNHHRLRLQLFPTKEITFWEYLGGFYLKSTIKKEQRLSISFKERLLAKVAKQHSTEEMTLFYQAIFFATMISHELREVIALLGVSHLVALSGFHLGILWGVVFGGLLLLYRPVQQRYFPYRYALFDVGVVAMVSLGIYVWFVGSPPSLIRAFAMVLMGWGLLMAGMALVSFRSLALIVALLLALLPSLVVSIAFWLSVAGVFYIFLMLHYSQGISERIVSLVLIPVGIFILMMPIIHMVFPMTSLYQLLSPLLSLLFILFYPLAILLHLFGVGGLFDALLMMLFSLPKASAIEGVGTLLWWEGAIYLAFSLGAIGSTRIFWGLWVVACGYMLYFFGFLSLFCNP